MALAFHHLQQRCSSMNTISINILIFHIGAKSHFVLRAGLNQHDRQKLQELVEPANNNMHWRKETGGRHLSVTSLDHPVFNEICVCVSISLSEKGCVRPPFTDC
jgi:hypothetical protein